MNNFVAYLEDLKSSLEKQEEKYRQTGRSTKIINDAIQNGSTIVCVNYQQKKVLEQLNANVRFITLTHYLQEKNGSKNTYLFDHYTIYNIILEQYSQLISQYGN